MFSAISACASPSINAANKAGSCRNIGHGVQPRAACRGSVPSPSVLPRDGAQEGVHPGRRQRQVLEQLGLLLRRQQAAQVGHATARHGITRPASLQERQLSPPHGR